MKHIIRNIIILGSIMVLVSGCSAVFKAGLSGSVYDADTDAGIENMEVYAYTSESARNTDFSSWTPGSIFSPDASSAYVARTSTASDGSFIINKIIWESTMPQFGKTADYRELFLIFYHKDYGLHKNIKAVWITSDSTNNSIVNESFSKINRIATLNIQVRNAASGTLLTEAMDIEVTVQNGAETIVKTVTITGAGTMVVSYPIALANPTASVQSHLNNSTYIQCDEEGTLLGTVTNALPSFDISEQTNVIELYMKPTRLTFPSLSGQIDYDATAGKENLLVSTDDGVTVWLCERDTDNKVVTIDHANAGQITYALGDGSNGSLIRHGLFDNLGQGYTWDDATYTKTYAEKQVVIVIDNISVAGAKAMGVGDYYSEFTIRSDSSSPTSLGIINTTATLAVGDLP